MLEENEQKNIFLINPQIAKLPDDLRNQGKNQTYLGTEQ
jgi:hypothetical protein